MNKPLFKYIHFALIIYKTGLHFDAATSSIGMIFKLPELAAETLAVTVANKISISADVPQSEIRRRCEIKMNNCGNTLGPNDYIMYILDMFQLTIHMGLLVGLKQKASNFSV